MKPSTPYPDPPKPSASRYVYLPAQIVVELPNGNRIEVTNPIAILVLQAVIGGAA